MKFIVRADAGIHIGTGHVMRCQVLARLLVDAGNQVLFVMSDCPGNLAEEVELQGFAVALIRESHDHLKSIASVANDAKATRAAIQEYFHDAFDWLIVDHYQLDEFWINTFIDIGCRIMVIDDLADRGLRCDILLDQTHGRSAREYQKLVSPGCKLLIGSQYCLLRSEFHLDRKRIIGLRQRQIESIGVEKDGFRILISFGGTDPENFTAKILSTLNTMPSLALVTAVMGRHAPHLHEVQNLAAKGRNISVRVGVNNMAELMLDHHLAIGAGGTSAWERCATGLPCLTFIMAENQRGVAQSLVDAGASRIVSDPSNTDEIAEALGYYEDVARYSNAVKSGLDICDGAGAQRVFNVIMAVEQETGVHL